MATRRTTTKTSTKSSRSPKAHSQADRSVRSSQNSQRSLAGNSDRANGARRESSRNNEYNDSYYASPRGDGYGGYSSSQSSGSNSGRNYDNYDDGYSRDQRRFQDMNRNSWDEPAYNNRRMTSRDRRGMEDNRRDDMYRNDMNRYSNEFENNYRGQDQNFGRYSTSNNQGDYQDGELRGRNAERDFDEEDHEFSTRGQYGNYDYNSKYEDEDEWEDLPSYRTGSRSQDWDNDYESQGSNNRNTYNSGRESDHREYIPREGRNYSNVERNNRNRHF